MSTALAEAQDLIGILDQFLEAAGVFREDSAIARLKAHLAAALAKAFGSLGSVFTRLLADEQSSWPFGWGGPFDRAADRTRRLFSTPLEHAIARAIEIGAKSAIGAAGIDLRFSAATDDRAKRFLDLHIGEVVRGIIETTKGYIGTVVSKAVAIGATVREGIASIKDRFKSFVKRGPGGQSRTETIAQSEVGSAVTRGQLWAAEDITGGGIEMEKFWRTMRDERVEVHCLDNEEAGWIPIDEIFPSGADAPLDHPRCRCRLLTRRSMNPWSLLMRQIEASLHDRDLVYDRSPESYRSGSLAIAQDPYRGGGNPTATALEQMPIRLEFQESADGSYKIKGGPSGMLSLIDGRHRWLAAILAGATQIQADVRYFDLNYDEQARRTIAISISLTAAERAHLERIAAQIFAKAA